MALKNYSYIGKGPIYARERGSSAGFLPVGNVSQLEFAAEENKITQPDYTQPGGGLANSVTRIDSVTASLTVLDISPRNLALAMRGSTRVEVAGSVTGEQHTAYVGALVPFDHQPDLSDYANTLVVTIDPTGTPTQAAEGTDYEVTRAGVVVLEGGAITDGSTIEVAYDKAAADIVEALTAAGAEFEMVFDGLNEAQSGKAVTVRVHRLKFSPAQGLGLIGDEFAELQMSADVLIDNSITGTGISRYFKVAMEQ